MGGWLSSPFCQVLRLFQRKAAPAVGLEAVITTRLPCATDASFVLASQSGVEASTPEAFRLKPVRVPRRLGELWKPARTTRKPGPWGGSWTE